MSRTNLGGRAESSTTNWRKRVEAIFSREGTSRPPSTRERPPNLPLRGFLLSFLPHLLPGPPRVPLPSLPSNLTCVSFLPHLLPHLPP